jgi:hypothetical protein
MAARSTTTTNSSISSSSSSSSSSTTTGATKPLDLSDERDDEAEKGESNTSNNQEKEPLWRLSPEESYSDWTIVIKEEDEDMHTSTNTNQVVPVVMKSNTYHVHKCMLAAGTCKSEYFHRLFQSSFSESRVNTSQITLHPLAANAFPFLLDYIYTGRLTIDTKTATALVFLAGYFENRLLQLATKSFWKKDFKFLNLHVYYNHASIFHIEPILASVSSYCQEHFFRLQPHHPIIETIDPTMLWSILSNINIKKINRTTESSLHASRLVVAALKNNKNKQLLLQAELFDRLTRENILPVICHSAAAELLDRYSKTHCMDRDKEEEPRELASIQKRCITSLATHWRELAFPLLGVTQLLSKQHPTVLVALQQESLQQANDVVLEQERRIRQLETAIKKKDLFVMEHVDSLELALMMKKQKSSRRLRSVGGASSSSSSNNH